MQDAATTVEELRAACAAFRDARNWKQFHDPKELALCMSLEVAEVLELFRFKQAAEVVGAPERRRHLSHEMADVLYWLLMMSDVTGIDLAAALEDKLRENERKYPVELAWGRNAKYTELTPPGRPGGDTGVNAGMGSIDGDAPPSVTAQPRQMHQEA
ncbi:MAG: MazG-like family protein [Candidatus Xenobia bacterium]